MNIIEYVYPFIEFIVVVFVLLVGLALSFLFQYRGNKNAHPKKYKKYEQILFEKQQQQKSNTNK